MPHHGKTTACSARAASIRRPAPRMSATSLEAIPSMPRLVNVGNFLQFYRRSGLHRSATPSTSTRRAGRCRRKHCASCCRGLAALSAFCFFLSRIELLMLWFFTGAVFCSRMPGGKIGVCPPRFTGKRGKCWHLNLRGRTGDGVVKERRALHNVETLCFESAHFTAPSMVKVMRNTWRISRRSWKTAEFCRQPGKQHAAVCLPAWQNQYHQRDITAERH